MKKGQWPFARGTFSYRWKRSGIYIGFKLWGNVLVQKQTSRIEKLLGWIVTLQYLIHIAMLQSYCFIWRCYWILFSERPVIIDAKSFHIFLIYGILILINLLECCWTCEIGGVYERRHSGVFVWLSFKRGVFSWVEPSVASGTPLYGNDNGCQFASCSITGWVCCSYYWWKEIRNLFEVIIKQDSWRR